MILTLPVVQASTFATTAAQVRMHVAYLPLPQHCLHLV